VFLIYIHYLLKQQSTQVHLLPNPNVLVAISKGMRAVKLCTKKILQFLLEVQANAG